MNHPIRKEIIDVLKRVTSKEIPFETIRDFTDGKVSVSAITNNLDLLIALIHKHPVQTWQQIDEILICKVSNEVFVATTNLNNFFYVCWNEPRSVKTQDETIPVIIESTLPD